LDVCPDTGSIELLKIAYIILQLYVANAYVKCERICKLCVMFIMLTFFVGFAFTLRLMA